MDGEREGGREGWTGGLLERDGGVGEKGCRKKSTWKKYPIFVSYSIFFVMFILILFEVKQTVIW